tara:strand:- start:162 stop:1379 length:1218 start_codon:yes stop_codon:yes gene_type:complete
MFSGIGGFELGMLMSGHKFEVVGHSEIDKYACEIYEKHFKGVTNYGDATRIIPGEIPQFDLLTGGFPCQAFSVAGLRRGWNDTRGTLFFDIARILRERKPKYILLENVKGLLSHNNGRTFQTILEVLSDIGYMVQWEVLNSKNFGVPQNRERVFIIGHLRGERRPKVFPFREGYEKNGVQIKRLGSNDVFRRYNQVFDKDGACEALDTSGGGGHTPCIQVGVLQDRGKVRKTDISTCIDANYHKGIDNHAERTAIAKINIIDNLKGKGGHECHNVHSIDGIAPTVRENHGKITMIKTKTATADVKAVLTPNREQKRQNGRRMKNTNEPMFTLTGQDIHGVSIDNAKIRRLTPLECERLQGFPDNWTECVSDTQRYKSLGNAVTTNVVAEVINKLYRSDDGKNNRA